MDTKFKASSMIVILGSLSAFIKEPTAQSISTSDVVVSYFLFNNTLRVAITIISIVVLAICLSLFFCIKNHGFHPKEWSSFPDL